MRIIKIKSNIRNYNVLFGNVRSYLSEIEKTYPNNCYIIDANVWSLYKISSLDRIDRKKIIILPISETDKNINTVERLYNVLIKRSAKRNLLIISIGGGITQDITGFLASTLYRGLKWIFIPTTLLAQADSCIGSKTSLNYKNFKNLIGTFYPPSEVFIDPNFLGTQKRSDFYSGLGEVIKLHIIGGWRRTGDFLRVYPGIIANKNKAMENMIYRTLLIKQGYIEADEFDDGKRNLLNYGHCFGHALETTSKFMISHGAGVVFGMMLANIVARKRDLLSKRLESFIFQKLLLPLVYAMPKKKWLEAQSIITAMKKDKKRIGKNLPLIILLKGHHMTKINDMSAAEAANAVRELKNNLFSISKEQWEKYKYAAI